MPVLASGSSESSVDVLVRTTADTAGATQTTAALEEMGTKAKAQADAGASSFSSFNKQLGGVSESAVKLGKGMTTYVSAPIAAIGYESIKMATTFQQTMEMLHTNAGTAQGDIKGLSADVLAMAPKVGAGPDQLAQAFYHIASAGNGLWSTSQQLNILKIAAEGAAIGQASLDDTTYSLTSALASNVSGAKGAAEMMATLNAIVGAGDMHMQDLNAAIGTGFLGTAETFGISIQSVGAALATLTDNGEHADAAATRLRMTWALMTAPSKQASKMLGDLGLNAEDAAKSTAGMSAIFAKTGLSTTKLADDLRQPNGMTVALKDLKSHLQAAGLSASETDAMLSKTFGGGRTDAALLSMLGNLDRMDEKFKMINANTSQFGNNWNAQQQTANQQFKESWAGIQASLIKLGDEIMPAASHIMKEFSNDIQNVSKWFGHLTSGEQDFILKTLAVGAVAGPAILILGKFGKAASALGSGLEFAGGKMGLFKTGSLVTEATKGASVLGRGAGLAGAAEALGPEAGAAAVALGPLALGIGAVAAVGIGAAIVIKRVSDNNKEAAKQAKAHGDASAAAAKQLLTSEGAQKTATKLVDDHTKALAADTKHHMLATVAKESMDSAQQKYNLTMIGTAAALAKYGPQSNQYLDALSREADANIKLGQATDAWNRTADAAQRAHAKVNTSAKDLNATYYTARQNVQHYDADSRSLNSAKDKEHDAHRKVSDAALVYNATIRMSGEHSDGAKEAAKRLVQAKEHEQKAQGDVSWWTRRVSDDLRNEARESDNLGGAIDRLAGKNGKLQQSISLGRQAGGLPKFAGGVTNFAGGAAIVGEQGPELVVLPPGSDVIPASQTQQMLSPGGGNVTPGASVSTRHQTVSISTIIINSASAATEFFTQLDQDNLLVGKGLTPNRGNR